VRQDNGQSYNDYLKELAQAQGIENPTREQLARLDRKRKKKGSNEQWTSPSDPEARITKMKDGTTHLAHKAEHAVDLTSGALVAVTLQPASEGDTSTIHKTLEEAQTELKRLELAVEEVVADKGYHSGAVLTELHEQEFRSYIPEPARGRRKWQGEGKQEEQKRTYENRRRVRGDRNKRLQKLRSELTERTFAHLYETGGMRRVHLRGRDNILKRLVVHGAAFNLSLILRKTLGVGKPRRLQGTAIGVIASFIRLFCFLGAELRRAERRLLHFAAQSARIGAEIPTNSKFLGKLPPLILRALA
jgi:transposase